MSTQTVNLTAPNLQTLDSEEPEPYETLNQNKDVKVLAEFLQQKAENSYSNGYFMKTASENLMMVFKGSKLPSNAWMNLLIILRDLADYCRINKLIKQITRNINAYVFIHKPF